MARSSGSIHVADNSVTSINDAIQQILFMIDELKGEHDSTTIHIGPHTHESTTSPTGGGSGGSIDHDELSNVTANQHHDKNHASSHSNTGADEITIENLGTAETDNAKILQPSGTGGVVWGDTAEETDVSNIDGSLTTPLWEYPSIGEGTIEVTINGGGVAITTGVKGDLFIPINIQLTWVNMLADQSGSIVVDIWNDAIANYPPTDADSITASDPPTISTATNSHDTSLSTWTTAITAGSTLRFNVDSVTNITRLQLTLGFIRTDIPV